MSLLPSVLSSHRFLGIALACSALFAGTAQAADVLALGAANGWVNGSCRKDYGSNDRAVLLQKPEKSC